MKFDVTNTDFERSFPIISEKITKSDFIAIDAEFSGISSVSALENSLFDTPEDRYTSVRENIKDYVIIQFGITSFKYNRDANKYTGSSYQFYVLDIPTNISVPQLAEKKLIFETEAADFLCEHGFDFDKLVHEGVGYLNNPEERKLRDDFEKFRSCDFIPNNEIEKSIQIECTRVAKWLESADNRRPLLLFNEIDYRKKVEIVLIVRRIQNTFPSVGIYKDSNGQVLVEVLEQSKKSFVDEDAFIDGCLGVTKLFRLLAKLRKPIVGHNLLLDLMFMYQQFYEPLPAQYKEFKKNLHSLFPVLYDTKFLSYELREQLGRDDKWKSNGLSVLYEYFKDGPGFRIAPFTPSIELEGSEANGIEKYPFHEAGWDSYCTGYCFIRIMHIFAIKKILDCNYEPKPVVSQQHFHAIKSQMNRVNVARAHVNHICLDGPDPTTKRPDWLVVTSLTDEAIDTKALRVHLCNVHGTFDIKTVSDNEVHIAANSEFALTEIMDTLKELKVWHVVSYNSTLHHPLMCVVPWIAGLSGLSLCALLMFKLKMK